MAGGPVRLFARVLLVFPWSGLTGRHGGRADALCASVSLRIRFRFGGVAGAIIGDLVGIANSIEKKGSPPSVRRTGFPVVVLGIVERGHGRNLVPAHIYLWRVFWLAAMREQSRCYP